MDSNIGSNNIDSNRDKYFKGQQEKEQFICFFRHHWIYLLRNFSYFIILAVITAVFLSYFRELKDLITGTRELKLLFVTGFLIYTFFFHRAFIMLLNYFINVGIITDRRIINHKKTLFFRDTIDAIEMGQIQNIEMIEDGFFPTLLGFGDLKLYLNASSSIVTFRELPNIKFHFRCINRAKEARHLRMRNVRPDRIHQQILEPQQQIAPSPIREKVNNKD